MKTGFAPSIGYEPSIRTPEPFVSSNDSDLCMIMFVTTFHIRQSVLIDVYLFLNMPLFIFNFLCFT